MIKLDVIVFYKKILLNYIVFILRFFFIKGICIIIYNYIIGLLVWFFYIYRIIKSDWGGGYVFRWFYNRIVVKLYKVYFLFV